MTRFYIAVAAAAAILGGLLGLAVPSAQAVTVYYDVDLHPGGQYDYLTCGWHGQCGSSPSSGNGIDFRNYYPNDSEWRSWNFRSDTATVLDVADATVATNNSACQRVEASIDDNEGVDRGSILFTHQTKDGSNFTLTGKDTGNWQTFDVADVVNSEPDSGCPFGGAHLHMETTNTAKFSKNTTDWPNYVNAQSVEATDSTSDRVFKSQWDYDQ